MASWMVIVVFLGCFIVAFLFTRSWAATPRSSDSGTCGACGYAVKGLTSFRCPECGADLQQVGINPPTPPASTSKTALAWAMMGVVLLMGMLAFLLLAKPSNRAIPPAPPAPVPMLAPAPPKQVPGPVPAPSVQPAP